VLYARLTAAPRGATGPDGQASAGITRALVAVLTSLTSQIKILSAQITDQLAAHADQHIFTSLPRSGTVRAARLLTEIGDSRARFPTPQTVPGRGCRFAHCSALDGAQSCRRSARPGTAGPCETHTGHRQCQAGWAVTQRHLGCISNFTVADTNKWCTSEPAALEKEWFPGCLPGPSRRASARSRA
jgi:hypothetical protein